MKDQEGNPVAGAKVIARKGVTQVGEFTDNGDGTYTLNDVMGTVSVVITKDGYTFKRQDNVSAANATITVTGTNDNLPEDSDDGKDQTGTEKPEGGCSGTTSGSAAVIAAIVLAGSCIAIVRRKRDI